MLCLRRISEAVQEQFPDAEALVQAGVVLLPSCLCKQVELYSCIVAVLIDCLAFVTFVEMLIVRLVIFFARSKFSLSGLATRRELQLLEGEADLGKVWHVPISWSMIMIRRCRPSMKTLHHYHSLI